MSPEERRDIDRLFDYVATLRVCNNFRSTTLRSQARLTTTAMAQYLVNKNVNLQLNVNNVADKRYFSKAFSSHYGTEADGRNAILSLNFKY
ncbi:MAG: TonB-dependent receptor [Sphingobacteriales bacterium]|nr:MAG: TonB-dependent receptor [Sphingobacteriales bacterium]